MLLKVCVGCTMSVCVLFVSYRVLLRGLLSFFLVCVVFVSEAAWVDVVFVYAVFVCDCVLLLMRLFLVCDTLCDAG